MTDSDIPPTEPQTPAASPTIESEPKRRGRPPGSRNATAVAEPPRSRATKRVLGDALKPDLAQHKEAVRAAAWYWIGALPGCPVENVHIGGQCFPKMEENLVKGADGHQSARSAVIGALVQLTRENVDRILRDLPRTIVRFRSESPEERSDREGLAATIGHLQAAPIEPAMRQTGVGMKVDVVLGEPRRRKGFLVTIPTAEDVKKRRADGRPTHQYIAQPFDEPCARYLFAKLCEDQSNPTRGGVYPPALEETGLDVPVEIAST